MSARILHRLRRSWDETVAPPLFGETPVLRRLLRMRLRSAFVLAIPAHLVILFYVVQGGLAHYRTVRGTRDREPLSLELFRLHVYDRLRRDYHRLFSGSGSPSAKLEKLSLSVRNDLIDRLDARLPPTDGAEGYVAGVLEHHGNRYDVDVRYRGTKHYNWNYAQKSWKVRIKRDRHLLGHDALLLNNSPEPEPLLELVTLDIAQRRGLMVPEYEPVWLELNGAPFGVYFFEAPVDESVLRHARRFPWNVYSGNGAPTDPKTGVSRLFESASFWSKVAGPIGQEKDVAELAGLLEQIRSAPPAAFRRFAAEHLDLEAFARLDAIDVVFGLSQHNYDENQKLYYDPYRGRFEPVVWNLKGSTHEPLVQRAPSPLVLRLSEMPSFVELRDEAVFDLLDTDASPAALSNALAKWDERLRDAFDQDPYWDAADLLPALGRYYADMVRPMDRARQLEARAVALARLRERRDFLRGALGTASLDARLETQPEGRTALVRLSVSGWAPIDLLGVEAEFDGGCAAPVVWRKRSLDATPLVPDAAGVWERLIPGTVRVAQPVTAQRGAVRLAPAERVYDIAIESPCGVPRSVSLRAKNRRTGERLDRRIEAHVGPFPAAERCETSFDPGPGARSDHPWCDAVEREPSEVRLGPGVVLIDETRVFAPETHVTIAPGTTVQLGKRANLVFRGRVTAAGTASQPIRFTGIDWGTIAIQGRSADGSWWSHVDVSGGSGSVVDGRHYTGMFSVYDTARFTLADAILRGAIGGDVLHLAYVRQGVLERVTVERSPSDGVDLEHSDVTLHSVTVRGAADDALDLMGARVVADDLNLLDCGDNGVSAGEQTEISLEHSVVARCPMGLLAKNQSRIEIDDVAVVKAKTGIRVERRSDYYVGESSAHGHGLWFVDVEKQLDLVAHPTFDVAPLGEAGARDVADLLAARRVASAADLVGWPGPGEVQP